MTRATPCLSVAGLTGAMDASLRIRVPVVDAIEAMALALRDRPGVLLLSTVMPDGFVGVGESFWLSRGLPSLEVLSELPRRAGAAGVLFGSRATGSVLEPDEFDERLFLYLRDVSRESGLMLVEHVLVSGDMIRLMGEADDESLG